MISAERLIQTFGLKEHPEGGYFAESYRSPETYDGQALPTRYKGNRHFSTAIFFLLPQGTVSRIHRIASDEIWHFYMGGPLEILQIGPVEQLERVILGQDIELGHKLQHIVPFGSWFGARPLKGSAYSFVGCTVAPGFDFADFELADPAELRANFPALKEELSLFA